MLMSTKICYVDVDVDRDIDAVVDADVDDDGNVDVMVGHVDGVVSVDIVVLC